MFKRITALALIVGAVLVGGEAKADEYNPLGPVNLGATVGVGFPSVLSTQVLFKYKKLVGANLELGLFPETGLGSDASIHQDMWDFGLRLYPFKGDGFIGLGMGEQWVVADSKSTNANAQVHTIFFDPRIGFLHRFDFGLAIGMDLGLEIPLSGDTTFTTPGNVPTPKTVNDVGDKAKTIPIPIFHLLQLGYVF